MRILVLGGTAMLGRELAVQAVAAGDDVVCLARGSRPVPEGSRLVRTDRDQPGAYDQVRGEVWDAVLDVTRQPGQARSAARELRSRHWVFVSSGNVYAAFDRPEQNEDSAILDPLAADVMPDMESYGAAKVACESAYRSAPGTATIARVGLIGGPGDESGRSGYYPWRFAHPNGDRVVVPDDQDFPVALIDVRDLAAWLLRAARERLDGTFNVTGPTTALGEVIDIAREVASEMSDERPRACPVSAAILSEAGITAWMGPGSLPLWIDDPDWRWFATMDTRRARQAGLRTRPLAETLRDGLEFDEAHRPAWQAGLTGEQQRAVLAVLDARNGR